MGESRNPKPSGILTVIMRLPVLVYLTAASIAVTSCGAITPISPTAPSATPAFAPATASGAPSSGIRALPITGTVMPVNQYAAPCWADRYACEAFEFSKAHEGPIEVTLTWNGAPRSLRVQLYWVGGTLAHEEIARDGAPSQISFMRPKMEAAAYRLRVVSLEPENAIPFTLTINY